MKASEKRKRHPRPYRSEAWGILSPRGEIWTDRTWPTPEDASAFLEGYRAGFSGAERDVLEKLQVIPVQRTVSALRKSADQAEGEGK